MDQMKWIVDLLNHRLNSETFEFDSLGRRLIYPIGAFVPLVIYGLISLWHFVVSQQRIARISRLKWSEQFNVSVWDVQMIIGKFRLVRSVSREFTYVSADRIVSAFAYVRLRIRESAKTKRRRKLDYCCIVAESNRWRIVGWLGWRAQWPTLMD